ncbi:MAG: urea ABC transporter permease subunit UrtC [Egibacteraceae bacterium]
MARRLAARAAPAATDLHEPLIRERLIRVGPARVHPLTLAILGVGLLLLFAPAVLTPFRLNLVARYLAFAVLAVGLDVAWGFGGMLSLGHGLFFGLGAYAMGMHLKLVASGSSLPDFMNWSGVSALPGWWRPFTHLPVAVFAAIGVPALAATALGVLVFRNRVRGAYFALLTQALVAIFALLLVGQQGYTGGTNGLTNFTTLAGAPLDQAATHRWIYYTVTATLVVALLLSHQLVRSRFGKLLVAVRDGEERVRFLGYNPATVKTVAFAFSAALAGLAGALYAPSTGIVAPGMVGIVPSIEMVAWVALGGRGTLLGAAFGAVLASYAKTVFSETLPSAWLYLQGGLLVLVIVAAPRGLAGAVGLLGRFSRRAREPATEPAAELARDVA